MSLDKDTKSIKDLIKPGDLKTEELAQAKTMPVEWTCNSAFHLFDLENIIANSWQYVCHSSQIMNPGDYFSFDIARRPGMIIRQKDHSIKALYNICKHRGGPLVSGEGNTNRIKCQYHGWTYDLDGRLKGTPEWEGVENFDKDAFCLSSMEVQIWQGLIFIHLGKPQQPLITYLDGISEKIAPINLSTLKFGMRTTDYIKCNWKLYVENFLEGYHLPQVHPALSRMLDYKNYIIELSENYSLQYSPFKNSENIYGNQDGQAYYYFIFPNTMLNILPGRLQVNRIDPLSPDQCAVHFDYFYKKPDSAEGKKFLEDDVAYSNEIQQEDIYICESVQKSFESGVYKTGRFSVKRESGVHHFQSLIKKWYAKSIR